MNDAPVHPAAVGVAAAVGSIVGASAGGAAILGANRLDMSWISLAIILLSPFVCGFLTGLVTTLILPQASPGACMAASLFGPALAVIPFLIVTGNDVIGGLVGGAAAVVILLIGLAPAASVLGRRLALHARGVDTPGGSR